MAFFSVSLKRSLLVLVIMLAALPVAAQSSYSALGLSASPTEYIGEITVPFGDDFSLYVFVTGPDLAVLPFELAAIDWALLGSCCGGSPAYYVQTLLSETLQHEGNPTIAVHSTADICVSGNFIVLAEVQFNWIYEPTGPFYLGVATLAAAVDCEGDPWIMTGLPLQVIPTGITPTQDESWSSLKTLFR